MGSFFAFITLIAGLVFAMGIITHASDTATVLNAGSNSLTSLFSLELGVAPSSTSTTKG